VSFVADGSFHGIENGRGLTMEKSDRSTDSRLGAIGRPGVATALALGLFLFTPGWSVAAEAGEQESQQGSKDEDTKKDTDSQDETEDAGKPTITHKVTVTATRTEEDTFNVPQPVLVVTEQEILERNPNSATDLMRDLPGVDVNGVGTNQPRPFIRGQRGQRILLLEDGLRLNNSRRQSDFGELPALTDIDNVSQVEVVRGPASVLYGSDAIGGVVNLITTTPVEGEYFNGSLGLRYSTADSQSKGQLHVKGQTGQFNYFVGGTYRSTDPYDAPGGKYGDITLDGSTTVNDTGVQDDTITARLGYLPSDGHEVFLKFERYQANQTGFGYVDPAEYDPGAPTIRLYYPFQDVDKVVAGYRGKNLDLSWADSVDGTLYWRDNDREFNQDIFIPFGPNSGLQLRSSNPTNVQTLGLRAEANKLVGSKQVLTYGFDWFEDDAEGSNVLSAQIIPFEPEPTIDTTPNVPNATYTSWGAFFQDQVRFTNRFSTIFGLRYQDNTSETEETEGLPPDVAGVKGSDETAVWAVNLSYDATEHVKVVGTVGRAFRSPNIIERFFGGPTPEGGGFQIPNPDLKAETSINYDIGLKYRRRNVHFEIAAFQNTIDNGIRIAPVLDQDGNQVIDPDTGLPVFQNVNVDELEYTGIETVLDWAFARGFSLGFNYTYLDAEDVRDPDDPIADSYSDKVNLRLRYDDPGGRFWAEYHFRRNGDQDDVDLGLDNPIGDQFPAFNVHALRGGVTLFRDQTMTHRLGLAVENLTDELYAEFSNASFFRPEPERNFIVTYRLDF
jgi:outer membrane receptor protein involved in Fe transport